jgi:aromatic ring-cleaving dioxygenase
MEQRFETKGDSQCYVDTNVAGVRDSFYVRVNKSDPKIQISIETDAEGNVGPQTQADYQFYDDSFQKIVNWLRAQGAIS